MPQAHRFAGDDAASLGFLPERRLDLDVEVKAVADDERGDGVRASGFDAELTLNVLDGSGDVALGLSTSGNSKNVIAALNKAKAVGARTICMTGAGGGAMKDICDVLIAVDSKDTPRIQESHILIGHILCELIENGITKDE